MKLDLIFRFRLLKERLKRIKDSSVFLKRIKEVRDNPKLAFYYMQGHINWYLYGSMISKFIKKVEECPDCFEQGSCKQCGCPFHKLAVSNKKCNGKKI